MLEGSSLRGGASRKIATDLSVAGRLNKGCIRVRPEMAQGVAMNPPKAQGRGGKVNGFMTWLQLRKN